MNNDTRTETSSLAPSLFTNEEDMTAVMSYYSSAEDDRTRTPSKGGGTGGGGENGTNLPHRSSVFEPASRSGNNHPSMSRQEPPVAVTIPPTTDVDLDLEEPSATTTMVKQPSEDDDDLHYPLKPPTKKTSSAGPNSKSSKSSKNNVVVPKSRVITMAILFLATLATAAYFFVHWYNPDLAPLPNRNNKSSASNLEPTTAGCVGLEQQEALECTFTLEDATAYQIQINTLMQAVEDLQAQNTLLTANNAEYADLNQELQDGIDELANQIDEYDSITSRLNATVEELKVQNQILSESNDDYEDLNSRLEANINNLRDENTELAEQVDILADLNYDLNVTADRLEGQVSNLTDQVDDLASENDRLDNHLLNLEGQLTSLTNLNTLLEANVNKLNDQVNQLTLENDRLETSVGNLQDISSFMNEAAIGLDETYDQVTEHLADMISTNRVLVMETMQNNYQQRVTNWDCAFLDSFALESFAQDLNEVIPSGASLSEILEYVNERVLSDLCLSLDDFVSYMNGRYNNVITTNRLITSMQRYTFEALEYYFPNNADKGGLTANDWAAADYKCGKLSANQQFVTV